MHTLRRLHEQLQFRVNERVDLKLLDVGRELIFKSQLKKSPTDPADITAYLMDHAVLLVRIKQVGKVEQQKAYRRVSELGYFFLLLSSRPNAIATYWICTCVYTSKHRHSANYIRTCVAHPA